MPATVPGCVHTDLLDAGLIPDPYLDDNERALAWIGRTDWVYETTFVAPARATTSGSTWSAPAWTRSPRVTLNGVEVGRTREHAPRLPVRRPTRCCATGTTT